MQAVILAGGPNRKLHPIDTGMLKFMLPFFDYPLLEYTIRLLVRHGVDDIIVTLSRQSMEISEYFGNGYRLGARIRYCVESDPLGTAGALKAIEQVLTDTFLVIPGDIITDADLSSAIAFHKTNNPLVTIIASTSDDPTLHTCLGIQNKKQVTSVLIKPSQNNFSYCCYVSTGMMIMSKQTLAQLLPFEPQNIYRDVLPKLLNEGKLVTAHMTDGYWQDINSILSYKAAHFAALEGRLKIEIDAEQIEPGIWIGNRVEIHPDAEIYPPVYVGSGAVISSRAAVGPQAIIGADASIEEEAVVKTSIIGRGSRVARKSSLSGCLLGSQHYTEEEESLVNCSAFNSSPPEDSNSLTARYEVSYPA
ncbi:MAG: sugar phosphate nucleotidyltransferase [Armatimonadota bacterium]